MHKFFYCIAIFFVVLLISGCSAKLNIKRINPSIIADSAVKKISIETITNDDISLITHIQSKLNNITFNNKKYFTVINRNQIAPILKEQKIQDSGLVDLSDDKKFELGEVESILQGSVNDKSHIRNMFYKKRTNYNRCLKYDKKEKKCLLYRTYRELCFEHIYTVKAFLSITNVENTSLIYSKSFYKQKVINSCGRNSVHNLSRYDVYNTISEEIANDFVLDISPYYEYFNVNLIEDEDIKYTENQNEIFENSLKLISLNHLDKAELLLDKLVLSTQGKSSTALYNLGLIKESLGKLKEAESLYIKAEEITLLKDLNEDIISAVKRIKVSILHSHQASNQINE